MSNPTPASPHIRRRKPAPPPEPPTATEPAAAHDVEDAFESVQQVVGDLEQAVEETTPPTTESVDAPDAGDALADEIQALLDADAESFLSPEEVFGEEDNPPEQLPATPSDPEPETIAEVDAMLAHDAEDALDGAFEAVDTVLGEDEPDESDVDNFPFKAAEPASPPETEADASPPDDFEGSFETLEEVVDPQPSPAADPSAEPAAADEPTPDEDDAFDGVFEAIDDLEDDPQPDPTASEDAPTPIADAASEPAATPAGAITITLPRLSLAGINLAKLRPAARRANDVSLWCCGILNLPLLKLPQTARTSVGWAAIATLLPGAALIVYGLLAG